MLLKKRNIFNRCLIFRAILVTNVSAKTSCEKLKLYFENKRRTNGGKINLMRAISDGVLIIFDSLQGYSVHNNFKVVENRSCS